MLHLERCSCNAMIVTFSMKRVDQWRESHRHEMPEEADQPAFVESGSSHERAPEQWIPEESRVRIGFHAS